MANYQSFFKQAWELIEGDGRATARVQLLSPAGTIVDTWIPSAEYAEQQIEFERRLSELKQEAPKGSFLQCSLQALDTRGCILKTQSVRIAGEGTTAVFGGDSFQLQQARIVESLTRQVESVLDMSNRQIARASEQWEKMFRAQMEANERIMGLLQKQSESVQKDIEKAKTEGLADETKELFGMALETLGPIVIEKFPQLLSGFANSGGAKVASAIVKG